MGKLALVVAVVAISTYNSEAMESKSSITELKIVKETSLRIVDELTLLHPEERYLNRCQNDKAFFYKEYSKKHNIDVKTLRGDNFQPREFWSQPRTEILHTLFPVIRKYKIFDIISFEPAMFCFQSEKDIRYDFQDWLSQDFSEIVEFYFEEEAYYAINKWMKKRKLKPIGWYDYQESLHNYYGAKQPLKLNDPKARRLPLYEYFLPYLHF